MFRLAVPVVLVLTLSLTHPVEAQSRSADTERPTAQELRARLDSLRPLLTQAVRDLEQRSARDRADARVAAAAISSVDTLTVGPMTVLTPVGQGDLARDLFTRSWERHFRGFEQSRGLRESVFSFQWALKQVPIHVEGNVQSVELFSWVRSERVEIAIRGAIGAAINRDLLASRSELSRWSSGNPLSDHDLERTYDEIALTQSRITRACLAGDAPACGSAMGLGIPVTTADGRTLRVAGPDQWSEWYTPEERRYLIAADRRWIGAAEYSAVWGTCVEGHEIPACDALLDVVGAEHIPLSGRVRETLIAYAVERGGAGAWERLLEQPDMSPSEALEYASAMPLPEVLAGWRSRVLTFKREAYVGFGPKSGLALLWTLFFTALAMRSTRWRLG